jgi:predicted MFS family arabinose efflux permease
MDTTNSIDFEGASPQPASTSAKPGGWSAVFALTLCVATLIASEFMPVSLLTPLATDLRLTEGLAGQAIAVSGLFAVLTSLSIGRISGLNRRLVLLALTGLMAFSGLLVAFAPNAVVFMIGRALIGVVIGGFWSLSAATVMRLVPGEQVPSRPGRPQRRQRRGHHGRGPAGRFPWPVHRLARRVLPGRAARAGDLRLAMAGPARHAGRPRQGLQRPWRPAAPPRQARHAGAGPAVRRPVRPLHLFAAVPGAGDQARASPLSLVLLAMGVAGLAGTALINRFIGRGLKAVLCLAPLAMAAIAVALIVAGASLVATAGLLIAWGLVGTALPVAWWTWLARTLPEDAEAGGGLMVAVIQMAITAGAAAGGLLFDAGGHAATFLVSAVLLCASAGFSALSVPRA